MSVLRDPDLVSLDEASVILGLSRTTCYELAKRGELPGALKLGGRWKVSLVRYRREIHGEA